MQYGAICHSHLQLEDHSRHVLTVRFLQLEDHSKHVLTVRFLSASKHVLTVRFLLNLY